MSTRSRTGAIAAALACVIGLAGCVADEAELGELEAAVALPPPANLTVTVISQTGMRLNWDASPGAVKYIVYRGTAPGNETTLTSVSPAVTTYTNNHLTPNQNYCWIVRNLNATRELSGPSNRVCASTATAQVPPVPTNVVATAVSSSRITVTWTASAGATSYQVWGAAVPNAPVFIATVPGGTTTYTHAGLTPSTTYQYQVRALNNEGSSAFSQPPATATTFAEGVELYLKLDEEAGTTALDASGFARNGTLSGGAAYSNDKPNVLDDKSTVQLPGGNTSQISVPSTAAFTLGTGPFTVALWVKVPSASADLHLIGVRNAGCGSLGWTIAQSAANGLYFEGETGGVRSFGASLPVGEWVHVAAVGDGANLQLYRNGVEVSNTAFVVGNRLTLPLQVGHVGGCTGGEILVDEVLMLSRALNASDVAAIGTLPDPPASLAFTNITSTRMDMGWTAVPNAAKYIMYRGTGPGTSVFFTSTGADDSLYSYGHLTPNTQYSWQVAVAVGQLFSFRSNEIVGTTLSGPPAPANVAATALSTSRIRVTWDAVPRATSYRVYQSIDGGAFAFKGTSTTTSFTAAGLAAATLHSYYVVTVDDGNLISPNSATVSATTL
jgi:fibronectin type 3 domain-containing protein